MLNLINNCLKFLSLIYLKIFKEADQCSLVEDKGLVDGLQVWAVDDIPGEEYFYRVRYELYYGELVFGIDRIEHVEADWEEYSGPFETFIEAISSLPKPVYH